jgi:hypothetical protein
MNYKLLPAACNNEHSQSVSVKQINILFVLDERSSVSIVSDYGLDDRDLIPDRGRGFFL